MITQRDLRRFQTRYHRNGVAGEGFYACSFIFRNGKQFIPLLAVVFDGFGQCAVTDPSDIESRFRGDEFESALRAAIAKCEENRAAE